MKQSEGLKKLDEFSLHRGRRPKSTFVPASQAPPAKKVRYHIDLSIDTDSDWFFCTGSYFEPHVIAYWM